MKKEMKKDKPILGIDLSHKGHRSGIGILYPQSLRFTSEILVSSSDILSRIRTVKPYLCCIDAPLTLPEKGIPWRKCDKKLFTLNAHPLPLTLPSMRTLAKRGKKLKDKINEVIPHVFETFPEASFQILGFEKKPKKEKERAEALKKIAQEFSITMVKERVSVHELDSFLCCLAGYCWTLEKHIEIVNTNCKIVLVGKNCPKTD